MAAKKFTIPSLSEMEKHKTEEYKVKTLFDKHRSNQVSPEKTASENGENKNVNGPDVSKPAGPKSTANMLGSSVKKTSSGFATIPGQEKQASSQLSGKSSSKVITASGHSQKASPQKTVQTSQQPKSASGGLSTGSHPTTGISPNRASKTASLIVSARQRGNPLLKHIRSVPWEFSDIVADYEMGTVMCTLFLSLRYHNLNPNYIHERLKLLGHSYDLRVLLVQVDTKDPHHALRELAQICILADCTLVCAWTPEEAARYLETYKVFEKKPPDMIMEKQEVDYVSRAQDVLTSGRKVNRTDVLTLLSTFGSFKNVVHAGEEEMSFCPGLGVHKAKRLHSLLHEPFLKKTKRKKMDE